MSPALAGGFFTSEPSGKPLKFLKLVVMVKVFFFLANPGQEDILLNSLLVLRFFFFKLPKSLIHLEFVLV